MDSDLCSYLSARSAESPSILDVAASSNPDAFAPYLLIAAVHSLVMTDPGCDLARFFPTVSGLPVPNEDAFPTFEQFILNNRDAIERLICSANVNKTVLRRSACLRAMLIEVVRRYGWQQVHLVDIGCSAGLNLLFDQWRISYGSLGEVGPDDSSVRFSIDVRIGSPPLGDAPQILSRTGIDLNRFVPGDPADEQWLLGFIFPDHPDVFRLTQAALDSLRKNQPRFVIGNASTELARVLEELPRDEPVVVMHSMTLHQMKPEHKSGVYRAIAECGKDKPIARIGMEMHGAQTALLLAGPGDAEPQVIGAANDDASWMHWND